MSDTTRTGAAGRVSAAVESVYGTEVARSLSMKVKSVTLAKSATNTVIDDLDAYSGGAVDSVQTQTDVGGEISTDVYYDKNMLGMMLYALFGNVTEAGSGPYTHAFKHGASAGLPSMSMEANRGAGAGDTEEFYGCQISKAVYTWEAGKPTMVTYTIIGKDSGNRGTQSVPATQTGGHISLGSHVASLSFAGSTYAVRKLTLTVDNHLEGLRDLGSLGISEAVRSNRVEVYLDVELTLRSGALYTAHKAKTTGAVTFTSSYSAGSSLDFSSPVGFIETYKDGVTTPGVTTASMRVRCLADPSGPTAICTMTLTNSDATYDVS